MTRQEKHDLVNELTESFKDKGAVVVCDYKGMSVHNLEAIRADARSKDVFVKVIKNTLAAIALKNADCEELELKDTNIYIWGEDQLSVCKVADKAATDFKAKFSVKSGVIESKAVDAETIIAMAKLPGREELLGMLLNVWNASARSLAIGLQALAEKRESEAQEA
ncbi:MAG: 50S ribosomal protein L10 [Sulfurovum sp. AS07-7]|nr:MAG: 50S ribosomal protein L10 [Sulfurovum sp. AS07-7]